MQTSKETKHEIKTKRYKISDTDVEKTCFYFIYLFISNLFKVGHTSSTHIYLQNIYTTNYS